MNVMASNGYKNPNAHVFDIEFVKELEQIDKNIIDLAKRTEREPQMVRKMLLEWVNNKNSGPGRPRLELDPSEVMSLASRGLTNEEIAAFLNCSSSLIEKNYSEYTKKGRLMGTGSLKREGYRKALDPNGSVSALIFMLKNECGFKDVQAVEHSNPDGSMRPQLNIQSMPPELRQAMITWVRSLLPT